jgi:hypothetical protein
MWVSIRLGVLLEHLEHLFDEFVYLDVLLLVSED